ncbi:MAG: hypothetical protein COB38_05000 [Gammaproteobacteria bacterium]|nr:MAG: hypothetical protein COB38_05000 [Gammaproteobacteria bacterium]
MNIEQYLFYIAYTLLYLVLAILMKTILNFRSGKLYKADEQIAGGNMAVGFRRSGAQLGLAIAMIGVLSGSSNSDFVNDLVTTASYGLLAVGFMLVSLLVTDRAVLPSVNNTEELKDGNLAIGLVEFGTLVMTGIIAYASIKGDDGGFISSLIYFVAGQVTVVLLVIAYEKVFARKVNLVQSVVDNNLSAGIYLSGKIIAYGLILQSAIVSQSNSASSSLSEQTIEFATAAFVGMIMLYLFELLIDRFIVTATKASDIIKNDQQVAALQLSLAKIGMALILGMAIL